MGRLYFFEVLKLVKKRLITMVIACILIGCHLVMNSIALEQSDLIEYRIPYFYAASADFESHADGVILPGEYSYVNRIVVSDDTFPLEIKHDSDVAINEDFGVCLNYDANYLYIAIQTGRQVSLKTVRINGERAFMFSVGVGINQSYPDALSYLENTYYFSPSDFSCIGVVGKRVLFSEGGKRFVGSVSSYSPETENAYEEDGVVWNGEKYRSEATMLQSLDSNQAKFECKIPWGDLIQIAPSLSLHSVNESISSLCGGFSFRTNVKWESEDKNETFLCGILPEDPCVLTEEKVSWSEYLANQLGVKKSLIPETLMLPLCFNKLPEQYVNPLVSVENEGDSLKENDPVNEGDPFSSYPSTADDVPPQNSTELVPKITKDPFVNLPQNDEFIPEESEIRYIKPNENETSEKEEGLGSTLLLIAGIFLFVSVVGSAFLFRMMEEKEKNGKEKKKITKKS